MSYPPGGSPGACLAGGSLAQRQEGQGEDPHSLPLLPREPHCQTLPNRKARATHGSPLRKNIACHPQASLNWPTGGWGRNNPYLESTGESRAWLSGAQATYFPIRHCDPQLPTTPPDFTKGSQVLLAHIGFNKDSNS